MLERVQRLIRGVPSVRIHVILTMLSKGGAAGFGAIAAAVIGSIGGAAVLGYYALIRVLPAIYVLLTELGISNAYPFLVKRLGYDPRRVYSSGMLAALIVGFVQLLIWGGLADLIRQNFLDELEHHDVILVGVLAPLQVLLLHATNLQRAVGQFKGANSVFVALEMLIVLALIPSLIQDEIGVSYLIHGVIAAHALVVVAVLGYLSLSGYSARPRFDREILARSVGYGMRAQVGNAFQVLNYRIDQVIVGGLLGAEALGPYVVAAKAAELFKFLGTSIAFVLESVLASSSVERATALVKAKAPHVFVANGAIVLVGVVVAPLLLPVFFGEWSAAAIWPFLIISIGMLVSGANGLYAAYNFSIGKPEWNTRIIMLGFAVNVLANLLLVRKFEGIGAAIAAALMQVAVTFGFRARFASAWKK